MKKNKVPFLNNQNILQVNGNIENTDYTEVIHLTV